MTWQSKACKHGVVSDGVQRLTAFQYMSVAGPLPGVRGSGVVSGVQAQVAASRQGRRFSRPPPNLAPPPKCAPQILFVVFVQQSEDSSVSLGVGMRRHRRGGGRTSSVICKMRASESRFVRINKINIITKLTSITKITKFPTLAE